jgi:hypothetical protein
MVVPERILLVHTEAVEAVVLLLLVQMVQVLLVVMVVTELHLRYLVLQ